MSDAPASMEETLEIAAEIHEKARSKIKKEVMRLLIETYYSKVQNILTGKSIYSESDKLCPDCTGVRLLYWENSADLQSGSFKSYKCPICKKWYSSSEVTSCTALDRDVTPVSVWHSSFAPDKLKPLMGDHTWIAIIPYHYREVWKVEGEEYGILSDGRVVQGAKLIEEVELPDLFGYYVGVWS